MSCGILAQGRTVYSDKIKYFINETVFAILNRSSNPEHAGDRNMNVALN